MSRPPSRLSPSTTPVHSQLSVDEQKPRKLVALFALACEVYLQPADVGAPGLHMADAQAVADVATRAVVGASRLSLQRIGSMTASLRRFPSQSGFCSGDFP